MVNLIEVLFVLVLLGLLFKQLGISVYQLFVLLLLQQPDVSISQRLIVSTFEDGNCGGGLRSTRQVYSGTCLVVSYLPLSIRSTQKWVIVGNCASLGLYDECDDMCTNCQTIWNYRFDQCLPNTSGRPGLSMTARLDVTDPTCQSVISGVSNTTVKTNDGTATIPTFKLLIFLLNCAAA